MRLAPLALLLVVACNDRPPTTTAYPSTLAPTAPNAPPDPAPADPGPAQAPGCGKPATGGALKVTAMGKERAFTLVVPDGYQPSTAYPLIFALHGSGGTAASARTATDLEKQAGGKALFAYPDAGREWDLNTAADTNPDVAFFDSMLFTIANTTCIDRRRVFVTGFSNGAYMANQLGCRRGDRIRGVVTSAGGGPYETKGTYDGQGHLQCAGKSVAALIIHGDADRSVLPSEGEKSIDHWTYANRCTGSGSPALVQPCTLLSGCFNPVGVCKIPGLGHSVWPHAGEATWQFVQSLK